MGWTRVAANAFKLEELGTPIMLAPIIIRHDDALGFYPHSSVPEQKPPEPGWENQPDAKRARHADEEFQIPGLGDISLASCVRLEETAWTASDIAKAGCLLSRPPRKVSFEDEEEMRRVYSLIYDVFRYKSVLQQALEDCRFFNMHPNLKQQRNVVLLLLYDLYKRKFKPRNQHNSKLRDRLFITCHMLLEADENLWARRIKIAAAIARIRIKHRALHLSQLLPPHLRDERVIALDQAPVTGWVNTFRIRSVEHLARLVENAGLTQVEHGTKEMGVQQYQLDSVCPNFIICHPAQRTSLAQSKLIKDYHVVLQDRAFCLGPAAIGHILKDLELTGTVAQTHINSPRTLAYLANILSENSMVDGLIAFGAGERKAEYDKYLEDLGVTNTKVLPQRFIDVAADGGEVLDKLVAVLATPPNTYTAVVDPVDLVCSRGGDLGMLEMLTATEGAAGSRERVSIILEEQRNTLRISMSKPNIQVVLYETHSIVSAENSEMVNQLVSEMNMNALEKHAEEQGKDATALSSRSTISATDTLDSDISVPPCDLFELTELPELCSEKDSCINMEREGCYLAFLKRKEIVRLNAKYMIEVAEMRGLFGNDKDAKDSKKSARRKRPEASASSRRDSANGSPPPGHLGRRFHFELERIAAPTHASILRSHTATNLGGHGRCCHLNAETSPYVCSRHRHHMDALPQALTGYRMNPKMVAETRRRDARNWWGQAAQHVIANLIRRSPREGDHVPQLQLTRSPLKLRVPYPVSIKSLEFDEESIDVSVLDKVRS